MWMTPEEEERFNAQFEAVYRYAQVIDSAVGAGGLRQLDDALMAAYWIEHRQLFPRLPKFRVRTDIEAASGQKPPRTGVYVAQDDEYATLQFAWRGNSDGILGEAETFNELGLRLLAAVGRDALWIDDTKLIPFGCPRWSATRAWTQACPLWSAFARHHPWRAMRWETQSSPAALASGITSRSWRANPRTRPKPQRRPQPRRRRFHNGEDERPFAAREDSGVIPG
jgi:hypothetical protein